MRDPDAPQFGALPIYAQLHWWRVGVRVSSIIYKFAKKTALLAPVPAFKEARYSLPGIMERPGMTLRVAKATLESLGALVHPAVDNVCSI